MSTTYRSGNAVKRFHTVNMLVDETVGHHSSNVAMLCYILSDKAPSVDLLMAALTHDHGEQFTGDIPAPAKWGHPSLALELEIAESLYDLPEFSLTRDEQSILKQADMLDLCYKCLEELRMGNRTVEAMLGRGLDYLWEKYSQCKLLNEVKNEYYTWLRDGR